MGIRRIRGQLDPYVFRWFYIVIIKDLYKL